MKDERYIDFLLDYHFEGALWTVTIKARSFHEAKLRLKAIAENGRIYGSEPEDIKEIEP